MSAEPLDQSKEATWRVLRSQAEGFLHIPSRAEPEREQCHRKGVPPEWLNVGERSTWAREPAGERVHCN